MSRPPQEREAILCKTSKGIPKESAISIYVADKASKVIPRPPDAEAVSPQIILTETASEIIGFVEIPRIIFCKAVNTAKDFITLP